MTVLKSLFVLSVLAAGISTAAVAADASLAKATAPAAAVAAKPAQTAAQEKAASAALSARLKALKTLSTEFTQTTQSRGAADKILTGTLQARKPGQFRWEVKQPFSQLIVADGTSVFIYDPDLAQLMIRPLGEAWGETPALLFTGDAAMLAKQFSVRQSQNGAITTFHLSPRAKDSLFTELNLSFKGDLPQSMTLLDAGNQRTEVAFFKAKRNVTLSNERFTFTPPAGTDIIRE
ncbi:MAG: outer membrane lipoprotein chaperone LolA [Paraperlucidibaca sp.]|uniref:outer membrane lipoprotein chaperone LolA n=1 Tax=Paraperlucidibaca sp. TaxID=2708021 RepID=UPI001B4193E2|nr:outer membrane lipoprotein chaperone LolA [Paraperlucidibaca sp.]MBQ0722419.1 outer membrane lipoprotein chaperone LolA [Paraperlucidibaca sp.]MBQ0843044.1 outer membrane lipoprotein chaperone LolA [Paraperlucidibaca sp.]